MTTPTAAVKYAVSVIRLAGVRCFPSFGAKPTKFTTCAKVRDWELFIFWARRLHEHEKRFICFLKAVQNTPYPAHVRIRASSSPK